MLAAKQAKEKNEMLRMKESYPCTILCGVVSPEHRKRRSSTNSHLLHKRHKIVWDTTRVLTNVATRMCTNRIKISQQYDFPFGVREVDITAYFFNEELKKTQLF